MNQIQTEVESDVLTETRNIEGAIRRLWDRARSAAEVIAQLREEKTALQSERDSLASELSRLRQDVARKEQEIKRLQVEHQQMAVSLQGNNTLTLDEREVLKGRIKDLIAKINSHL